MSERGVVHILVLLILIAAIIGGVYLATHPQIFRSRASVDNSWLSNLNMTDAYGDPINCYTTQDPPICYVSTDNINLSWQGK